MDKPLGQREIGDNTNGDDPVISPTLSHADYENDARGAYGRECQCGDSQCSHKRPPRREGKPYWRKLLRAEPDRLIELIFAFIIAIFAGVQWWTSFENNNSTTRQTDQLIAAAKISAYAANQNAFAAQSFASSAAKINQGVSAAVGKLSLQAKKMDLARESSGEASRTALRVIIENARNDQRAWVAAVNPVPKRYPQLPNKIAFEVDLVNTGKTPALDVDPDIRGQRVYDMKGIPCETVLLTPAVAYRAKTILIPGAPNTKSTTQDFLFSNAELDAFSLRVETFEVCVKISYNDIFKRPHVTQVCYVFHGPMLDDAADCDHDNYAD